MSAISKFDDEPEQNGASQYLALFQPMHDLHDKLLAMDYSKQFVSEYKCPPINRYYFCRQANQAQQFFAFCCLSSFLLNKANNRNDFKVDSFDDPNLTIDRILNAAQAHVDISPFASTRQKFKQGFGNEVIGLLSRLVDKVCLLSETPTEAAAAVSVRFVGLDGGTLDEMDEEDEIDNEDNEIELEEEFADYIEENGNLEENIWDEDGGADGPEKAMIAANTDLTEWKLELERILPQLNARLLGQSMWSKGGAYDSEWRLHYKAAMAQHSNIDSVFGQTATMVGNLSGDIKSALDKIDAKENYLRQNSSTILAEWATVRERAERLRSAFEAVNKETSEKADRLAELSEEDRTTKQAIEEYSLRMTDSSPLVEAKKAREMLKQELVRVNLQIGVAIQTLVRHITLHTSPVY